MSDIASQVSLSISDLIEQFNIITHNLANVSTVGYKRVCSTFSNSLQAQQDGAGTESSDEAELETMLDFSQGSIVETGRPLDFALYGKGFFVIETPEGPLYARNGMFRTNENGQIVDSEGRIVAGQAGPITIPVNVGLLQLNVSSDGTISAGGTVVGQFRLVYFGEDESKLVSAGASCFLMPDENIQPVAAENIVVKQGYQEASNVQMVEELVNMIMVTRLYEANMNVMSAQQETSSSLMDVAMG
ncbi:MAG: flagellar hook-basal body protein [Planctomycetota bacterium]|jgi:flagellar basal body rod protein FlgG